MMSFLFRAALFLLPGALADLPAYCESPFDLTTPGAVNYSVFSYPTSYQGCEWNVQAGDGMLASITLKSNISVESANCRDFLYAYCLTYTATGICDSTPLFSVCNANYPCMNSPALQYSLYDISARETNATSHLCPRRCNECESCNYNYISVTGSDGVEYYRGCGYNPNPVTITANTPNVTVRIVRGYLQQNNCRNVAANSSCVDDFGAWALPADDRVPLGPLDFLNFEWTAVSNTSTPNSSAPCNGLTQIMTAPGVITSNPGSHYANNANCTWEITAPSGQHVALRWRRFSLQPQFGGRDRVHPQVPGIEFADFLTVRDGNNSVVWGPFAGTRAPGNYTSASQSFTINFQTDDRITDTGFLLEYDFVPTPGPGPRFCSGNSTQNTPGTVIQDGPYPASTSCNWRITAPNNQFVKIDWAFLSIEGQFAPCISTVYDFLQVRDANGQVLQRVCGNFLPPSVVSLTNSVDVSFFSDTILFGDGFMFNYSFVSQPGAVPSSCASTLEIQGTIGSKGVIQDGLLIGNLSNPYRTCNWFISGPSGSVVRLKFTAVRLERCADFEYPDNGDNQLTVFDGQDLGASSISEFCGTGTPGEVVSTSNQVLVRLRADGGLADGFMATYSIEPGPSSPLALSCRGEQIISSGLSGLLVDGNLGTGPSNCSWRFTAPIGHYVQLTVLNFSIGIAEDGCSDKWFAAYDGASEASYPFFSTCGVRIIPGGLIVSSRQDVLVRFADAIGNLPNIFYIEWAFVKQPGTHSRCFNPILTNQITGPSTVYTSFGGSSLNQTNSLMTYFRKGLFCAWRIPILDAAAVTLKFNYARWSGIRTDLGLCGDYLTITTDDSLNPDPAESMTLCSNANASLGVVLEESLDVPTTTFRYKSDVFIQMRAYQDFQFALDVKYVPSEPVPEGGVSAGYVVGIVVLTLIGLGAVVGIGCYCKNKRRAQKEGDPSNFDLGTGQHLGTSAAGGESSFNFGRSSGHQRMTSDD